MAPFNEKHPSNKGFTLIELLVSVGMIGIILIGFISLQLTFGRANISGDDFSQASALASQFIDSLKNTDYYSIPVNDLQIINNGRYVLSWIAYDKSSAPPYSQDEGLKLLNLKISWLRERNHEVAFVTYLAEMF